MTGSLLFHSKNSLCVLPAKAHHLLATADRRLYWALPIQAERGILELE